MRLITVIAGLFVAVIFVLDSSVSVESTTASVVVEHPRPVVRPEKPHEKHVPVSEAAKKDSPATVERAHFVYKNSSLPSQHTGRAADYIAEGQDLWKEFFNSLYVDRYGRGVKTQTALSALNVGNLAVLGIVVLGGLALVAPLIFPEPFKRSMGSNFLPMLAEDRQLQKFLTSGLVGVSESIMGWVEKSVDDLPSFPRLDGQECLKRCICEAHNQPKKYGLVGLVLQLFFPPYTETDEPSRIVSKYQLAARYGRQDTANCQQQYDGCMVNILDAAMGVINFFF